MNILEDMIKIQEEIENIDDEYTRLETLAIDLEDLKDRAITWYYSGNAVVDDLNKEFPNWQLEAQEIIDNPDHEVFKNADYHRKCEIFDLAMVEIDINHLAEKISDVVKMRDEAWKNVSAEIRYRKLVDQMGHAPSSY